MKTLLTIAKMVVLLHHLEPFLARRYQIGYVAARNYRILTDCLTEYTKFRNDLIGKYGEPDLDEKGKALSTISIKIGSPNFERFCDEMQPLNNIEHEVEVMTARYKDVIGELSGKEILSIDWMLED